MSTFLDLFIDGIQDAVDKLPGAFTAKLLGDFYGLVDDHRRRRVCVQKLIDRYVQDAAIQTSEAIIAPIYHMVVDLDLNLFQVDDRIFDQLFRKGVKRAVGVYIITFCDLREISWY